MDESLSPIAPAESAAPDYKDRSTGLMVFGILTLLQGCLCGLMIPLMLFGQVMAARTQQPGVNTASLLPGMLVYVFLAVALIWLGIGSIKARRWARALLLIYSWSWLLVGVLMLVGMMFILPKTLANPPVTGTGQPHALPPGTIGIIMFFTFVFLSVFFVVLPAVWIYFYNSRHVKATCEARDPVVCWTDVCPLPVLALCVWGMFSVPVLLVLPLVGHGVVPFFGTFLTGVPGALLYFLFSAVWAYAAWRMYQLKPVGWWLMLGMMVFFMVSSLITFARHDVLEMYQLMGYSQAQIDQIQRTGMLTGNGMDWVTAVSSVPYLGYLIFIKKYFRSQDRA